MASSFDGGGEFPLVGSAKTTASLTHDFTAISGEFLEQGSVFVVRCSHHPQSRGFSTEKTIFFAGKFLLITSNSHNLFRD